MSSQCPYFDCCAGVNGCRLDPTWCPFPQCSGGCGTLRENEVPSPVSVDWSNTNDIEAGSVKGVNDNNSWFWQSELRYIDLLHMVMNKNVI